MYFENEIKIDKCIHINGFTNSLKMNQLSFIFAHKRREKTVLATHVEITRMANTRVLVIHNFWFVNFAFKIHESIE